jgi:NTP pyrophosphatase (non-canonical NTP hydrolase)
MNKDDLTALDLIEATKNDHGLRHALDAYLDRADAHTGDGRRSGKSLFHDTLDAAHRTACDKGWWEGFKGPGVGDTIIPEKIALIHSEVSEALEAYRAGLDPRKVYLDSKGKPEGVAAELADVLIRMMDLCGALDIPLWEAVVIKMRYNESRPHRHGGKTC